MKALTISQPFATHTPIRIGDSMRFGHAALAGLFGERFSSLVAEPIQLLHAVMRQRGLGTIEATLLLCQSAVEQDPCGSVAHVMWLHAACVELVEGTPLGEAATLL